MKQILTYLSVLALTFSTFHYSTAAQAVADRIITLTGTEATGRAIVLAIREQTPARFTYDENVNQLLAGPVKTASTKISVRDALEAIRRTTGVRYEIENDSYITLTMPPRPPQPPGTVRGRIVEFETSEPLAGATVRITGRSQGIQSDENGYYRFSLPEGTYTLEVSYIGFTSVTQRVAVRTGQESTYDIKLQGDNTLGEVVVEGRARFSKVPVAFTSERQLIEEVKMSRSVISGVSNEQITRMADRNAAEVVKRISGVSVVDDKFIVVRGMNQRYNLTYLNQNVAPSTELYSRAFAYDMLPTPIIDRILVYKSPAAELLGDYAGGAVRIYTKNTSPVRALNIGVQVNYRQGSTFDDIHAYKGGKLDWMGFDDGTRKMPGIPGYRETSGRQTIPQEQLANAFTDTWQYGRLQTLPDMQLFMNYFDNWRVFGRRLYSMTALTYTNEYRRFEQRRMENSGGWEQINEQTWGKTIYRFGLNDQSMQLTKLNLVQNFTYRLNDSHRLEFSNFLLNDARDNVTVGTTNVWDFYVPGKSEITRTARKQNTFLYQQRLLYNGNLGGVHKLRSALPQELQWNLGYSRSHQDIPDQRVVNFVGDPDGEVDDAHRWFADIQLAANNAGGGMMNRLFLNNTEDVYNVSADYSKTIRPEVQLKAGTYQLFRTREMGRRFFKVLPGNYTGNEISWESNVPSIFENDPRLTRFSEGDLAWVWNARSFPDDGTGLRIFDVSSPIDRYVATEQNNSGYVQGEWTPLEGKVILNAGIRLEHNRQQVAGASTLGISVGPDNGGQIFYPVPVDLASTDWLPSVNLNYRPDSTWVLRASYGRTVNRPELREIAPFNDFDYTERQLIQGNPSLQRSTIDNYDLRLEFYPRNPSEAISIGAFYKRMNQPIERVRLEDEDIGFTLLSFINSTRALVYGVELELRKSLAFIPGNLFRNLSVVVNGTYVHSDVSREDAPIFESTSITDFSGRPLQGQAPYVFNGGLFYENAGWGTKVGVIYNVTGPSIFAIGNADPERAREIMRKRFAREPLHPEDIRIMTRKPSLIEVERHLLDFSFTQRLYRSLSMRLNVQNLLDQPYRLAEDNNWDFSYDPPTSHRLVPQGNIDEATVVEGDNELVRYHAGRYINLSFTYAF